MSEILKTILETDSIARVNLAFMDKAHFEEVQIVKDLGELITAYQDETIESDATGQYEEKITVMLITWLRHTIASFSAENELMQQINFPTMQLHTQEHETELNRIKRIVRLWKTDKNITLLADFVFNFWPNWLVAHINSMDIMMARFAVMNGYRA